MPVSAIPSNLRLGTSSFASDDWVGSFYPEGTRPEQYIERYAERFGTVEIDSTFYGAPSPATVSRWRERTPDGFVFAAKVPRTVTHTEITTESLAELSSFLDVMRLLGPKLGPLLFQFSYVSKSRDPDEYATGERFRARLMNLLERLPADLRFVVEVRNERWVARPLLALLRSRAIALAFIDYYTTPSMFRLAAREENLTAEFAYVRFLGNHREMDHAVEKKALMEGKRWDRIVQNRSTETRMWLPALRAVSGRAREVFVYFNNHYAGNAPGSIELFRSLWSEMSSKEHTLDRWNTEERGA